MSPKVRWTMILSFLLCAVLFAQEPTTSGTVATNAPAPAAPEPQEQVSSLKGTVLDASSREPIGNATVTILGSSISAVTTPDGRYTLRVNEPGIYQLKASAVGYEPQIMNNVEFIVGWKIGGLFSLSPVKGEPDDYVPVEKQPQPIAGHMPPPMYPEIAKRAGVEGVVWVKVWVDKQGAVKKVVVLRSDAEIFNQAAIDAAKQWSFTPAVLKGSPVDVWVSIPFKFKMFLKEEELDVKPEAVKSIPPKYPAAAQEQKVEATVWLSVSIDEKGNVLGAVADRIQLNDQPAMSDASMIELMKKSNPQQRSVVTELMANAVKAVRQWTFRPARKAGNAVKARIVVPIKYSLGGPSKGKK